MVQKYYQFLNENLKLSDIEIGEWIFIENNPHGEQFGNFDIKNRLGRKIENHSKISSKFIFTEKINNSITHTFYNANKLEFKRIDEEIIKKFNDKKLIPLVRSNELIFVLNDLNFKYTNYFYDCSFFDIDEKNDSITYLPINKINEPDPWTSKSRQSMRLGKFFKKLNNKINDTDLEKLINSYKSKWDELKGIEIKIVSGEDIRYWYHEKNYFKGGGKLNSSCMRYEESQKRFDIYCDHPDKINMAIIVDKKNKLLGRALIWKLDKPSQKLYMDRIYTTNDYMDKFFVDYANKNNMLLYDEYQDDTFEMEMDIHINNVYFDADEDYYYCGDLLPYMDTFRYYYPKKDKLCSCDTYGYSYFELDDHD